MLRGLRKASANWLGKAVMAAVVGFLIISFGIWGIGDIFRGITRTTVAKIGGTEITGEQFRTLFNDRLQQLSRQANRTITPDQARSFGFDQQLLGQLVAETALDERAGYLHLGVPDSDIARRIVQDPAFRGLSGQFDQSRFEQLIRQAGYTEARYVAEQRRLALRRQLAGTVTAGTVVPLTATEAFNRFENEERTADYVVLGAAAVGDIPAPESEVLAKYFNDRKTLFRAPEYRKLTVLTLTPDEIARTIEVSDADAQAAYDQHKARYTTPERRDIQQIVFPNEDDAKKAAERIAAGTAFDALATERGMKPSDVNLGLVPKSGIVDPAVADVAFSLKDGTVSEPVKGRFGVSLVRVNKIEPEQVRSFADVESDLKRDIALDRARAEVSATRNKIEDELAGGARLDEVAQKLKIPFRTVDAVDRSGRGADGKPIPDLPGGQDLLNGAFASDVGVENDPIQSAGGYVWYDVGGITPSHERPLDEVKEQVEARWRGDQVAEKLKAKADEMVEKLKSGTPLTDLATADGLKIDTAKDLKRRGNQALPAQVVSGIFATAKDAAGTAEGADSNERYVFRVTGITDPAFDKNDPTTKRISDTLRETLTNELLAQYVTQLENEMGVTINQAALVQAIGSSGQSGQD